jgi:hypothetical protein
LAITTPAHPDEVIPNRRIAAREESAVHLILATKKINASIPPFNPRSHQ